jgi:hypothetical protein
LEQYAVFRLREPAEDPVSGTHRRSQEATPRSNGRTVTGASEAALTHHPLGVCAPHIKGTRQRAAIPHGNRRARRLRPTSFQQRRRTVLRTLPRRDRPSRATGHPVSRWTGSASRKRPWSEEERLVLGGRALPPGPTRRNTASSARDTADAVERAGRKAILSGVWMARTETLRLSSLHADNEHGEKRSGTRHFPFARVRAT